MTRNRRSRRYLATVVLLALVAFGLAGLVPRGIAAIHRGGPSKGARPASIQSLDTVVVFSLQKYNASGSWAIYDDGFTADTVAGRRYLIDIGNGSTRASNIIFTVNDTQYVGSSEFGTGTSEMLRVINAKAGYNTFELWVKGSSGSYVYARVLRVNDPTFSIYGPRRDTTQTSPNPIIHAFTHTVGDTLGSLRFLNGNPDGSNRITNSTLTLNGTQVLATSDFTTGIATVTRNVTVRSADTLSLLNQGATGTVGTTEIRVRDLTPPVVAWTTPADSAGTNPAKIATMGSITDETPGTAYISVDGTARPTFAFNGGSSATAFSDSLTLSAEGRHSVVLTALNSASLQTTITRRVWRDTQAPTLTLQSPAQDTTVLADHIHFIGTWQDSTKTTVSVDGDTVGAAAVSGAFDTTIVMDLGPNPIICRAVDAAGNVTQIKRVVFLATAGDNPPSAPSPTGLFATSYTSFLPSVAFLYRSGTQSVPDTTIFDPARASVIRGRTIGRDFGPIGNVKVQVLGHSEFGSTYSRADGEYELIVNGGGPVTCRYTKSGYIESQRTVTPLWNDYSTLDDVAMVGLSAKSTVVANSSTGIAHSRFASDANGDRDMHLIVPQGTTATVTTPGGTNQTFSTMTVRAKEFTVGPDGPKTMPAQLPPSSAYTYCADLRIDEANGLSSGGDTVVTTSFSKPIACYLKNFLHQGVGTRVPLGYYDQGVAEWKGATDGVIVKILGFSSVGDTAHIDSRGTGTADDSTRLAQLGITAEELTHLKSQYAVGDTAIRIAVDHFSWWDINYNLAALAAAFGKAFGRILQQLRQLAQACLGNGSIIECENRILGQRFAIPGTPYSINYRSSRAIGDLAIRTLRIPVVGATIPDGLTKIHVNLDVAGRHYTHTLTGPFSSSTPPDTITWDGMDCYGRRIQGAVNGAVSLGYEFASSYAAGTGGGSYGDPAASGGSAGATTGDRSIGRVTWSHQKVSLGAPSTASDGLGGWTLSSHHVYDPTGNGAVYLGDGTVMFGDDMPPTIHLVMGGQPCQYPYYTLPPPNSALAADDIALGPDGSLYIADNCRGAILRLSPAGVLTTLAGKDNQPGNYDGDGVATNTHLPWGLTGIALAADGTIYFSANSTGAHTSQSMIGYITPAGYIKKLAGVGSDLNNGSGDGGPIGSAKISTPVGIALGPDGSVFFAEYQDHVIRRIAPNGIVTRYAGTGSQTSQLGSVDSTGPATTIRLGEPQSILVDTDGNLYLCEAPQNRIRQVTPDGLVATWSSGGFDFAPYAMAFASDGSAYISCAVGDPASNSGAGHRIWQRSPDGTLGVIAGGGLSAIDGTPAAAAQLYYPRGIAVAQDGSYYLAHGEIHHISRTLGTTSASEIAIPSHDGSEIFSFSIASGSYGRHLRTRDALTGAVRYRFGYDSAGRLSTVTDVSGLTTTIQRDGSGNSIAILGPFGHRTRLSLDANGYLSALTDTLNRTLGFTTGSSGLLSTFTDALGNVHSFTYAADGRLQSDAQPASTGGSQTLTLSYSGLTRTVTRTTAETRVTTYAVTDSADGARRREIVGPDNLHTVAVENVNSRTDTQIPEGSSASDSVGPDTRFGMAVPILRSSTFNTPGGLSRVVETSQAWSGSFDTPLQHGTWSQDLKTNGRTPYHTEFHSNYPDSLLWRTRSPLGRAALTNVDTAGRPLSTVVTGLATSTYSYDAQGRLIHLQVGSERAWAYAYDAQGRLATVTDTLGRIDSLRHDAVDRVTAIVRPDSQRVLFSFDGNNNMSSLTPAGGSAHTYGFDAVDATLSYLPPVVGGQPDSLKFGYNHDGQTNSVARPGASTVPLTFESGTGRLSNVALARGDLHYAFKSTGQIDSVRSPDGVSLAFGYDGMLLKSETWVGPIAGHVDLTFDPDLRPNTQAVDGSNSITLRYDLDGLLAGAGIDSLHYSGNAGLLDSTSLSGLSATSSQDYNAYGELANLHYGWSSGGSYLQSLSHDQIGRISTMSEAIAGDTTRSYSYVYTNAGRLKDVIRAGNILEHYEYDPNGNRTYASGARFATPISATYDAQDRLTQSGTATYAYTRSGALSYTVVGTDTTYFTYDELGNLVTVMLPTHHRIDYLVDGRGRRVGRKVDGVLVAGWLYQNDFNVVAELDGSGVVTTRYVYGSRANTPDYMVRSGTTYRIVSDAIGSVRMVANASSGAVAERIDYDAYGRILADTNPGFVSLGFAGGITDPATGLSRFGARDYDPTIARWTCKDPIRFAGGSANLFAYADGDPVNLIDPTGTDAQNDLDGIAGGADALSCGLASHIRDKYFSYNNISKTSAAYRKGHREGRAILAQLALSSGAGLGIEIAGEGAAAVTSVFWSGGQVAEDAATAWATSNGGATLAMSPYAPATREATVAASRAFAEAASGEVHVFLSPAARADGIWQTVELKALERNPNVTNIVKHFVN